jgi:hypothetical protein
MRSTPMTLSSAVVDDGAVSQPPTCDSGCKRVSRHVPRPFEGYRNMGRGKIIECNENISVVTGPLLCRNG